MQKIRSLVKSASFWMSLAAIVSLGIALFKGRGYEIAAIQFVGAQLAVMIEARRILNIVINIQEHEDGSFDSNVSYVEFGDKKEIN
jgi:hypothetical protein